MIPPPAGEDKRYTLFIHTELIGEHGKEFFRLLLHAGKHLIVGAPYDMVGVKIKDQVCPAPALVRHGPGIRLLVIRSRVVGVLRNEILNITGELITAGEAHMPPHPHVSCTRVEKNKTPLPLLERRG